VFFSKNWIFDFCFDYADGHRDNFTKEQLLRRDLYTEFVSFVSSKKSDFEFDLNANEKSYLIKQLKANIGRALWGNDFFYGILLEEDRFVEIAKKKF
jgi:hypothetical protein